MTANDETKKLANAYLKAGKALDALSREGSADDFPQTFDPVLRRMKSALDEIDGLRRIVNRQRDQSAYILETMESLVTRWRSYGTAQADDCASQLESALVECAKNR